MAFLLWIGIADKVVLEEPEVKTQAALPPRTIENRELKTETTTTTKQTQP
jgi:hypothetical protein